MAALTGSMIFGTYRHAQVRSSELIRGSGAAAIVAFVWLIVGLTLGVAFTLRAAGVHRPATIATVVGAVVLACAGPLLMRALRRIMLGNRAGTAIPGSRARNPR